MFLDHNETELEISNKEVAEEFLNIWKLNRNLINNQITSSWPGSTHLPKSWFGDLNLNSFYQLRATEAIALPLEWHSPIFQDLPTHVQLLFTVNCLHVSLPSKCWFEYFLLPPRSAPVGLNPDRCLGFKFHPSSTPACRA